MKITLLDRLQDIAADYDDFILDLWGVLHNGQKPYPGVVDCLMAIKRAGKKRVILSNAPRRIEPVIARITEIGIPPDAYDGIMTSGQDTWEHLLLRGRPAAIPFYAQMGKRCLFIGPERDLGLLEKVVHERVEDPRAADFYLCTGIVERDDMLDVYEPNLKTLAKRGTPMICAPPFAPGRIVWKAALTRRDIARIDVEERYLHTGGLLCRNQRIEVNADRLHKLDCAKPGLRRRGKPLDKGHLFE